MLAEAHWAGAAETAGKGSAARLSRTAAAASSIGAAKERSPGSTSRPSAPSCGSLVAHRRRAVHALGCDRACSPRLRASRLTVERGAGRIAYAGEPGAFAEDAVIAAFGDDPRLPVGGFREVFEAVTRGEAGRASCRSRTSSTARSARCTTCCSSTSSRSPARWSCRSTCASPRCPEWTSKTSSACTRRSRRWVSRSGFCAPAAGIC